MMLNNEHCIDWKMDYGGLLGDPGKSQELPSRFYWSEEAIAGPD